MAVHNPRRDSLLHMGFQTRTLQLPATNERLRNRPGRHDRLFRRS